MILTFQKQCLLSKLTDEFISNGINPLQENNTSAIQGTETEVYIYVPDDTPQDIIDKITLLVENHDPVPFPQPPTPEERLESLELALLELL